MTFKPEDAGKEILKLRCILANLKMNVPVQRKDLKRKRNIPFKSPKETSSKIGPEFQQTDEELRLKLETVNKEIKDLKAQGCNEKELQTHIDKLHEYNEIKDVGQLVLGRLATIEGVRSKDLYERYNLLLDD